VSLDGRRKPVRRRYRPKVEALEALRLLDAASSTLFPVAIEQAPLPSLGVPEAPRDLVVSPAPLIRGASSGSAEWDLALGDESFDADWMGVASETLPDREASTADGLAQLNRYLGSAWARAGIAPQQREDCTQAVHTTLLQQVGRDDFDLMLADIGRVGVSGVLNRDTSLGPDFFRAVDMVKKRAQRQRAFVPLDQVDLAENERTGDGDSWRNALDDAIDRKLETREADLIRATLEGFTPAEIAQKWGLAPKTISNEKSRVFQKLREALTAELVDA
jgi:hypothetical protein